MQVMSRNTPVSTKINERTCTQPSIACAEYSGEYAFAQKIENRGNLKCVGQHTEGKIE